MPDKPMDNEILNLYVGDIDFANKRIGELKEALAASKKREEEIQDRFFLSNKAIANLEATIHAKDAELLGLREISLRLFACLCAARQLVKDHGRVGQDEAVCKALDDYQAQALSKSPSASLEELKAQIRREALEEAAKTAEENVVDSANPVKVYTGKMIADAIRSLSPAPGEKKACGCDKDVRNPFCTHPLHGSGEKAGGEA